MRQSTRHSFYLSLIIFLTLPVPALALPAITCHCFKDRSFDAGRPAAGKD